MIIIHIKQGEQCLGQTKSQLLCCTREHNSEAIRKRLIPTQCARKVDQRRKHKMLMAEEKELDRPG